MTWRMARSLDVLLAEINAAAPGRSKASDGGIGDPDHSSRVSDHNPNAAGVVRARDFTHDPAGGLDCNDLAADLAGLLGKHPALGSGGYMIWNRRIISTDRLGEGWRAYTGANGHTHHCHVSVATAARGYDATAPWAVLTEGDEIDMATKEELRQIVREELRALIRDDTEGQPNLGNARINDPDGGPNLTLARLLYSPRPSITVKR